MTDEHADVIARLSAELAEAKEKFWHQRHEWAAATGKNQELIDTALARAEAAERDVGALSTRVEELLARAEAAEEFVDEWREAVEAAEARAEAAEKERDEAREFAAEMEKEADRWERSRNAVLEREQVTRARCATLEAALREIVGMPTTERNPDGEEQAAHSIKVVAADALAAASQPAEEEET